MALLFNTSQPPASTSLDTFEALLRPRARRQSSSPAPAQSPQPQAAPQATISAQASAPTAQPSPAPQASSGPVVIAQIDQFTTDASGFNHGEAVAQELTDEGGVELIKFDVSGSNTSQGIANSLETILQRVKNGERIDAVNISQQQFNSSADTQRVQQAIDELQALGVPVAVAAGNGGRSQRNQLASNNAFIVESSDKSTSGVGNVSADGRTTSFATANLAPVLARLKAQGLSLDQIRQQVSASG